MTIKELIKKLERVVDYGYGDKVILVEDGQENFHIDSIQKNTHPDIEPDYLFLLSGKPFKEGD